MAGGWGSLPHSLFTSGLPWLWVVLDLVQWLGCRPVKQLLLSAWVRPPSLTADHFHSPRSCGLRLGNQRCWLNTTNVCATGGEGVNSKVISSCWDSPFYFASDPWRPGVEYHIFPILKLETVLGVGGACSAEPYGEGPVSVSVTDILQIEHVLIASPTSATDVGTGIGRGVNATLTPPCPSLGSTLNATRAWFFCLVFHREQAVS